MLRKVDRILLRVPQLEAAVRYYRDVLGMKPARQTRLLAIFALQDGDGTELVLHADPDQAAEATYFLVEDVRDLYRRRDELRLKFAAPPAQVSRGYKAQVRDPFGNVLLLIDRSSDRAGHGNGDQATSGALIEDAKAPVSLFAGVVTKVAPNREVLARLYEKVGRTADDLPYTPHFESLYAGYVEQLGDAKVTRQEVWRHLLNMRKAGQLPKLGEARSRPPTVPAEARQRLRAMLGADLGKRDRLPYTERFEKLADEFNKLLPRRLSPHLVWRLVATLAK